MYSSLTMKKLKSNDTHTNMYKKLVAYDVTIKSHGRQNIFAIITVYLILASSAQWSLQKRNDDHYIWLLFCPYIFHVFTHIIQKWMKK